MRRPSVSMASLPGSVSPSNRRGNRLALAVGVMDPLGARRDWLGNVISKTFLWKATETTRMSDNKKRVAWITGGGSGIGLAGAQALAAEGWTVVISGRRKDVIDAAAADIAKTGGKVEAMALDVGNADDVNAVAQAIIAKHGRIDLLVNSAGLNVPKRSWDDVATDGWDKVVDINL